jgi:Uma2 family endonuclease
MTIAARYDDVITLPRAVRFPVEMLTPEGFDAERLDTWPDVAGRLEYVDGRLLFIPPCGDVQQDTTTDVVITLGAWVRSRPGFVLGTNEAGMRLLGSTRAADAAIWRAADVGARTGGLRRVPPLLAVEVAGAEPGDGEEELRAKAAWYLAAGVRLLWIVLPEEREVIVIAAGGDARFLSGAQLPEHPELPGLSPAVDELFVQIAS